MAERASGQVRSLLVRNDQPLIGVIVQEGSRQMVRYFAEEDALDTGETGQSVEEALSLAGAWSDLDWDEAVAELDRIRHQSQPTPPITDL